MKLYTHACSSKLFYNLRFGYANTCWLGQEQHGNTLAVFWQHGKMLIIFTFGFLTHQFDIGYKPPDGNKQGEALALPTYPAAQKTSTSKWSPRGHAENGRWKTRSVTQKQTTFRSRMHETCGMYWHGRSTKKYLYQKIIHRVTRIKMHNCMLVWHIYLCNTYFLHLQFRYMHMYIQKVSVSHLSILVWTPAYAESQRIRMPQIILDVAHTILIDSIVQANAPRCLLSSSLDGYQWSEFKHV